MNIFGVKVKLYRKKRKRVGRGSGSGHGKTSCRGHKGQKSRAGFELKHGFEGGQIPLIRRIPKRGFVNKFRKSWQIINLEQLNEEFDKDTVVSPEVLKEMGLIKKLSLPVKVLAEGKIEKSLVIKAHSFSKRAKEEIEKKGGAVELIPVPRTK